MPRGYFERVDKYADIVGTRFGKLVVTDYYRIGYYKWATVLCDCGTIKETRVSSLVDGYTVSCGCHSKQVASERLKTHGLSKHPLYSVLCGMHSRCYDSGRKDYKHYGGRGITVCDRWSLDEAGINNFIEDMSGTYQKGLEIERVDVNGNYCPENCTWETRRAQVINRRPTGKGFDTHFITFNGETLCISQWADKVGIQSQIISDRINKLGWKIEDALTRKVKVDKVVIMIDGVEYSQGDIFVSPPNRVYEAKNLNLSTHQYIANLFYNIANVKIYCNKTWFPVEPTEDLSSKLFTKKLTKAILDKLGVIY